MRAIYVQYGCGLSAPDGWLNFDASPRVRMERSLVGRLLCSKRFPPNSQFGDIVRGLPVKDGTAKGVYGRHVLEHMRRRECAIALRNTMRMLAPAGIFRAVVPDLRARAERYLATADANAAHRFMESIGVVVEHGRWPTMREVFGNSRHLWMWDERSLTKALSEAGFTDIRRCQFGDCSDPVFQSVEEMGRFVDGETSRNARLRQKSQFIFNNSTGKGAISMRLMARARAIDLSPLVAGESDDVGNPLNRAAFHG